MEYRFFLDELFYILRKIKYLFIWQNRDNVNNNIYINSIKDNLL